MEKPNYSAWPQRQLTQDAWDRLPRDYKGVRPDGTKTMLILEQGETTLAVVTIKPYSGPARGRFERSDYDRR